MEISPYAIMWVSYCWFVAVVTVIALMIYGVHTLTDQRILVVAGRLGSAVRQMDLVAERVNEIARQMDLLLGALEKNLPLPDSEADLEISSQEVAEMANTLRLMDTIAMRLGITRTELMRRTEKILAEREHRKK